MALSFCGVLLSTLDFLMACSIWNIAFSNPVRLFLTPRWRPMWKSGISQSAPTCSHRRHLSSSGPLSHRILLFLQFRHAACLGASGISCWRVSAYCKAAEYAHSHRDSLTSVRRRKDFNGVLIIHGTSRSKEPLAEESHFRWWQRTMQQCAANVSLRPVP